MNEKLLLTQQTSNGKIMSTKMIEQSDIDFLKETMNVDIDHLMHKLTSKDIVKYKDKIIDQIHKFIKVASSSDEHCAEINKQYNSTDNSQADLVLDSIRVAIYSFCKGGLKGLWIYQENQDWYPKIILKEIIEPNDIEKLPEILTIYRGGDLSEYNNSQYGQAWTTSFDIAKHFSYTQYCDNSWFKEYNRSVFKAQISKNDIFYSNQENHEKEIIVDTCKLIKISRIER